MGGGRKGAGLRTECGRSPHRILMVSDFFYPNFGGVENHIYQLSQCLISMGLKVIVVTHAYGDCRGVRYLTNGLKVYYLPRLPFYQQATFPTLLGWCRLLRVICVRERITLVHGHQAFSTMALEACVNGRSLGLKVVFTDHSLFGFADPASIVLNKVLKAVLADVHAVICVSHTSKENTVLRACLPPAVVSVIPNAVDASQFQPPELHPDPHPDPDPHSPKPGPARPPLGPRSNPGPVPRVGLGTGRHPPAPRPGAPSGRRRWPSDPWVDEVVLVVLCRLVYRKGVDLLSLVLPAVCGRHPNVRVIVGGDGPKRALLGRVIQNHRLEDRVVLEGPVPHERARDFMVRGHVFVNASLTEAFCMALVEAAAAGLVVVSTAVGGVPEVLPPDMIVLSEPSAEGLLEAIEIAILRVPHQRPAEQHVRVRQMYNWNDVARRTVHVYDQVAASVRDDSLQARLQRYGATGRWVGAFFGGVAVLSHLVMLFLQWWQPREQIDEAADWPRGGATEPKLAAAAEAAAASCTAAASETPTPPPLCVKGSRECLPVGGPGASRGAVDSCGVGHEAPLEASRAGVLGVGGPAAVATAAMDAAARQRRLHAPSMGVSESRGVLSTSWSGACTEHSTVAVGVDIGGGRDSSSRADVLADSRVYGSGEAMGGSSSSSGPCGSGHPMLKAVTGHELSSLQSDDRRVAAAAAQEKGREVVWWRSGKKGRRRAQ